MTIRFGVHCSLKNGLSGALEEARQKGCESMQIFTRSPRMWKMRPPAAAAVKEFKKLRKKLGIFPVIVHAPYLPNLATSNKELYLKSKKLLKEDLLIAENLEVEYLVIHPGSYSEDSTLVEGIKNISKAINGALSAGLGKTMILLETVAGGGRRIGSSFKELKQIMDSVNGKHGLGICLDTAHSFAAGYDLSNPKGIDKSLNEFDEIIGLDNLKVIHFNDSMASFGSRKDRHEHIGRGHIGLNGFKYLVKSLKNKVKAGILETPKDSEEADLNNLSVLFQFRN